MAYHKVVSELMSFSINSYYMWKKENRPIMSLLQKYLSEDDIKEFLNTGSISKFENINYIKYDFNIKYFNFIIKLGRKEITTFLSILKENKDDLLNFSNNFITILLEYDCDNQIKRKLIENYSKIENKNELFYYGLKNMLNDKFRDFYEFSIEYIDSISPYVFVTTYIKIYLEIFENKKCKELVEVFPGFRVPDKYSEDADLSKLYFYYLVDLLD